MNAGKLKSVRLVALGLVAVSMATLTCAAPARAQGWPAVFDPLQVLTLNLQMDPADWTTIQNDLTLSIEVPATFWADGEAPITVGVRRKSSDPLGGGGGFLKVSLKVDINEFVTGQLWHDLSKLSLENGDDTDVLAEGFAWYVHRLASGPEGYGYAHSPGLASWVKLYINGTYTGVYVNAEQRNKRFLKNRNLWVKDFTWLYKNSSLNTTELVAGPLTWSPAYQTLCYFPFMDTPTCSAPGTATLLTQLESLIDMKGLLTLGAMNAFVQDPDDLWIKGKNAQFADFTWGPKRRYFPWDLDAVTNKKVTIIPSGFYADLILSVPEFLTQYKEILSQLLQGPLSEANMVGFLNALEPILTPALQADPNNQMGGSVAGRFDGLRNWVPVRIADALAELPSCNVQPGTLDFGTASSFKDTTFTIVNVSSEPISGNVSESCGAYEVLSGGGPFTLGGGGSRVVNVRFTPPGPGTWNCTIETGTGFCLGVSVTGTGAGATGIDTEVPPKFMLRQNHPNPFNRSTRIGFELQEGAPVVLDVYDISGRLVRRLVGRGLPSGTYSEVWNGRDRHGNEVASGVYVYRLTAGERTLTRKAVLLR